MRQNIKAIKTNSAKRHPVANDIKMQNAAAYSIMSLAGKSTIDILEQVILRAVVVGWIVGRDLSFFGKLQAVLVAHLHPRKAKVMALAQTRGVHSRELEQVTKRHYGGFGVLHNKARQRRKEKRSHKKRVASFALVGFE